MRVEQISEALDRIEERTGLDVLTTASDKLAANELGWSVGMLLSGAYGIPQALPASKLASAGDDWKDDAATQITRRWWPVVVRISDADSGRGKPSSILPISSGVLMNFSILFFCNN